MAEEDDATLTPEMGLDEIFELEKGMDDVGDELDAEDPAGVVPALTLESARAELADVEAVAVDGANTTGDVYVDCAEGIKVFLESLTVLAKLEKGVTCIFEREAALETLLRRWVADGSLLL